ncbi:putative g-patch domain-containing protein [Rosellinia necatrix]|uniref:Putative g-patch domain-containing protein n=1 Tax=Rosellinia necatrix TaxID=77044 RepID=A0A1W2TUJ1_ROSNE|nr:putative g-patch domain-containing protein [Rosellinia necatrix]
MPRHHANISKADAAAYSSSEGDESDDDGLAQPSVDPRADDFLDFNPRKRRKTGRNTKESAALGIFASDSEDNDAPNRRWKSKRDLRHKNVTFVSAGQEQLDRHPDQGDDDEDEDEDGLSGRRAGLGTQRANATPAEQDKAAEIEGEDEDEDEDEDEEMTGVGLGFRSSTQGLGFGWGQTSQAQAAPNMVKNTPSQWTNTMKAKYDGSTPLGTSFVPTSAKEPVLKPDLEDDKPSSAPQTPKPSAFAGGGGSKSKSFAARMMAKMGYVEGKGLGANAQGRASIIEATLRPQGNVGLGTVREKSAQELKEEKRQARLRGEEVSDSDEERKKTKHDRRKKKAGESGSGSGMSTPKRSKPKYMTVSDIQKAAPGLHIPEAFAPILDMTGRDQRLLTSGSGLLTPTAGTELVEQTEARKLARRAQGDLAAFVEEWKTLEERKAWVDMEALQRQQEVDELESEFSSLQMFSLVLDEVCLAAREQQWDPIISGLKKAEASASVYNEELSSIAVAGIHPFLAQATQGWQPLEDPNLGNFANDLIGIKILLGIRTKATNGGVVSKRDHDGIDNPNHFRGRSTTPYESMIYKLVFPKIVTAISQAWDIYDATPLLAVLDRWEELFPAFVRSQLLEQVVRRLEDAITNWRPKKERTTLPHLWLFPWLQHLPPHHLEPKGTGLVSDVRRKFRQTIDTWQFDRGVVPGLKPWQDIFRPSQAQDQWKPLVMHHILPSMGRYLRTNFRVDPGDQEPYLKMLQGVVKWVDVISSSMIAEVVVTEVFPMWHDVLHQWLTSDEANYEEIGAWFEWWHNEVFPPEIASHESIKAEFQRGTAMIEQALELGDEAKHRLPRPDKRPARPSTKSRPSKQRPEEQKKPKVPVQPMDVTEPTFRDEVESWCQENDLQFIPIRKANELGKHYFRLTARLDGKGGVLAYFGGEGDVLVVESRKTNGVFRRAEKTEWGALLGTFFGETERVGVK